MLWLTTDLPEPDSPTTASVVAGRIRKLTPLTAWMAPGRGRELDVQVLDPQAGRSVALDLPFGRP